MLELTDLVRRTCRYRRREVALLDPLRGGGEARERERKRARRSGRQREREQPEDHATAHDRRGDLPLGIVERRERQEHRQLLRLRRV